MGFAHGSKAMVQDTAQMHSTELASFAYSTQELKMPSFSRSRNERKGSHDLFDRNADNRGEIFFGLEGCGRSLGQSNHQRTIR